MNCKDNIYIDNAYLARFWFFVCKLLVKNDTTCNFVARADVFVVN